MVRRRAILSILLAILMLLSSAAGPEEDGAPALAEPLANPRPTLTAEIQLSPDGSGERYLPDVAYNGLHHEYLVVWHNTWPGGERDIYARRVSSGGRLLSWFCVTTGGTDRLQPAVAYNPFLDTYLVVWAQETGPGSERYEIWGRIIPWDGPGTNPDFLIFSWPERSFWTPRVAFTPLRQEYLVVWGALDTSGGLPGVPSDIAGCRVSAAGAVTPLPVHIALGDYPHQADLAYDVGMDEYLVVYVVVHSQATTGNDIVAVRLDGEGVPIDPPGRLTVYDGVGDDNAPSVATNSQGRYLVAWEHTFSPTDIDIYARAVFGGGGMPLGVIGVAAGTQDNTAPDVAAGGSGHEWLVVWQDELAGDAGDAVVGEWLSFDSTWYYPRGTEEIASYLFWSNERPAAAGGRPGYLIAYEGDSSITNRHIFGRVLYPAHVLLPLVIR